VDGAHIERRVQLVCRRCAAAPPPRISCGYLSGTSLVFLLSYVQTRLIIARDMVSEACHRKGVRPRASLCTQAT
jgi:hypothetical protein